MSSACVVRSGVGKLHIEGHMHLQKIQEALKEPHGTIQGFSMLQ